jgi:hypothetical protein
VPAASARAILAATTAARTIEAKLLMTGLFDVPLKRHVSSAGATAQSPIRTDQALRNSLVRNHSFF